MSDTEAMVRLMEHAAGMLVAQADAFANVGYDSVTPKGRDHAVVAMAYGAAVLRMVAASVAPEAHRITAQMIDRLSADYPTWADQNDGVGMSDGEIRSITRFLRWVLDE